MDNTEDYNFYDLQKQKGLFIREMFEPLEKLSSVERYVFIEYYYFNTSMKVLSKFLKLSDVEVYEIFSKAKDTIKIDQEVQYKIKEESNK